MNKVIFGIFAHPDDEAFGPCGTLLKEVRGGAQVHLITLTSGQAGMNPDAVADLGETRLKEWHEAGRLLGATSMHHLGYEDGTLNNLRMIEVTEQITQLISSLTSNEPADSEIEFMIFDLNGLTGHIDHIVASRSACKVFYTLKAADTRFTRTRLYCAPDSLQPTDNVDWIYAEKGRSTQEIAEVVDARLFRDDILAVMRAHHTQRSDCEAAIKSRGDTLGLDSFLVKT